MTALPIMKTEAETPGRRTMMTMVDYLAEHHPDRVICKSATSLQPSDGFSDVCAKDLSHAVDSTAWMIDEHFDASTDGTLMYLGENDVRYLAVMLACQKSSNLPLFSSTANSVESHVSLAEQTKCNGILFSRGQAQVAKKVAVAAGGAKLLEIPTIEQLTVSPHNAYPSPSTYYELEDDAALILHSSGTTGFPKAVRLTYGFLGTMDKQAYAKTPQGRRSAIPNQLDSEDLFLPTTPFSHIMGVFAEALSVFQGVPYICAGHSGPLTSEGLVDLIKHAHPTVAVLTPSLVEGVSKSASTMEALSTLRMICIGGAPLAPEVGHVLSRQTNLVSVMGSSELGLVLSLVPGEKKDWEYFEWNPSYAVRMDPIGKDSFELVITRGKSRDLQGIFHTYPKLQEYHTKDLFSPHPIRKGLWKFEGRADDTVSLSDGTKLNPIPMEKAIEGHPLISRAVVIGHGRNRLALLVEPHWHACSAEVSIVDIVEKIWPIVALANNLAPPHAQIGRNRIGLASRDKPFEITPKGSTKRQKVLASYSNEIEALFEWDACCAELLTHG